MLADVRGRYNKTRSADSCGSYRAGLGGRSPFEGRPVAGAIKGHYILRAAADTSVGFNSRALRFKNLTAIYSRV